MYQAGRASWIKGSVSARQQKGYSWRYFSEDEEAALGEVLEDLGVGVLT